MRRALSSPGPPCAQRDLKGPSQRTLLPQGRAHLPGRDQSSSSLSSDDDGGCRLWCYSSPTAQEFLLVPVSPCTHQLCSDTAPQLAWSLCHRSLQSSPSDNLECPYLQCPQTVPIKRILDFSLSRDVIHSQQADFSLHKTYNPDSNQSKVGVVAGQPVSGGLACYFKDKSIYFSSPSSSEHLLLPVSPCPFHYRLEFHKGGALLLPENADRPLLPRVGCEMSASRPAPDAAHSEPGTRYINNSPHTFLSPAIC